MSTSFRSQILLALTLLIASAHPPLFAQGRPPPIAPPAHMEKSPLKKTGGTTYEMGGLKLDSATREIRVPCSVNMTDGIIEYALVTENGKTHESLLKTKAKPFDVQVAMLLCHYEPQAAELVNILSRPEPELIALAKKKIEHSGANHVKLTVEWTDKSGAMKTAALDDWIHNHKDNTTLKIPFWIFNGSDLGDGIFMAEGDGSFISVHFDLVGIIGSPAKWVGQDDNWEVETKAVPPIDTPVTLIIQPAAAPSPTNK